MALAGGVTGGVGEGGWERGWNPLTYKSLSIGQKTNTCQCTLSLSQFNLIPARAQRRDWMAECCERRDFFAHFVFHSRIEDMDTAAG